MLEHAATQFNTGQITGCLISKIRISTHSNTLQHTATHCNTPQHCCNTLQHTEHRANNQLSDFKDKNLNIDPQLPYEDGSFDIVTCVVSIDYLINPIKVHTATHRSTLQRTATHCNALQHTATRSLLILSHVSCRSIISSILLR